MTTNTTTETREAWQIERDNREAAANAITKQANATAAVIAEELTKTTGDDWKPLFSKADNCFPNRTPYVRDLRRTRDGLRLHFHHTNAKGYGDYGPWIWSVSPNSIPTKTGEKSLHDFKTYDQRYGKEPNGKANISATKTPAKVAADIVRRVLPVAEALAAKATGEGDAQTIREAWLQETLAIFRAACPAPLDASPRNYSGRDREKGSPMSAHYYGGRASPSIDLEFSAYGHTAEIKLRDVPRELAAKILALLPKPEATETASE